MRSNSQFAGEVAGAEHFESGAQFLNHTELEQPPRIERVAFQLLQPAHIHGGILVAENVGKPALGQTAMERHLAALETAHDAVAGNGSRALCPSAGILAASGSHALSDALLLLFLPARRAKIAEIHDFLLPLPDRRGAGAPRLFAARVGC